MSKRPRVVTAVVLMPVMLAFLAMVGASAFAKPNPSAAQYQYKVTLCHKTGSETNPGVTITVSANAAATHMAKHGDTLGPCPANLTSSTPTSSSSGDGEGPGKGQGQGQGNGQGHGNGQGQGQGNGQGESQGNGKGKNK
jgi:hypothetical protein